MTFADTNFDALDMKTAFGVAARSLDVALNQKQILAASIFVRNGSDVYSENLGLAQSDHAAFLLGSITKPIVIAALMSLHDEGLFQLEDPVTKYLPEFTEGNYRSVQVVHLLTHTCGLPDQLPNNAELRAQHAPLSAFVESCRSLAFHFQPGTKYEYSSMGILLASEIAQRISGLPIHKLVAQRVFVPLGMHDSALGLGDISESNRMPCQVEFGAPEAGGGEESTKDWNWNSPYWRSLGAPWGGCHASAADIGKLLLAMMKPTDDFLKASTKRLMITNHNAAGLESRGLGFDVDMTSSLVSCSPNSFGHTGSTGTFAWADLDRHRLCVVLTTLPARALEEKRHPRHIASECIARAD